MANKKAQMGIIAILAIVALVLGILYLAPSALSNWGIQLSAQPGQPSFPSASVTQGQCDSATGGTLRYALRSRSNSTLWYPIESYVAIYDSPAAVAGMPAGTGATAGATSLTYDADITGLNCGSEISIITLGSTTSYRSAGRKDKLSGTISLNNMFNVDDALNQPMTLRIYDNAYVNQTTTLDAAAVTTGTIAADQNVAYDYIIHAMPAANSVWGNFQSNEGLIAVDLITSATYDAANGVTLSANGLDITPVPSTTYNAGLGLGLPVLFKTKAISSGIIPGYRTGPVDIALHLYAANGAPGATDNVVVYFYTPGWFQDTNGNYAYGVKNSVGTVSVGVNTNTATIDQS